jgi:hypothetical protein
MTEWNKPVPEVDVDLFHKAFAVFHKAVRAAEPENRDIDWIAAVCATVPAEACKAICGRIGMLDHLIHSRRAKILKLQGFPGEWVEVAATAPLLYGKRFNHQLFPWRELSEGYEDVAEAVAHEENRA